MTLSYIILLFCAGVLGGTLNSVAGGGSFIGFPALVFTGIPSIQANASNTVALWPGSIASVGAYRREIASLKRGFLMLLVGTSLIGGILGAILLLGTPEATFESLVPFLLLLATALFAFSGPITAQLRKREPAKTQQSVPGLIAIAAAQFVIAIYGGYFGGGIGILMLATLAMMGLENIHVMNGMKTLLQVCINGVAVVTFIVAGAVNWPGALVMMTGAIVGGYGGAYFARKIEPNWIRLFVILVGTLMTLSAFFSWPPGFWN